MKPPDSVWRKGEPHARRYPDRWQDKGEWPWWIEAFEGIVGYLVIGVLFLAIIVAWPR